MRPNCTGVPLLDIHSWTPPWTSDLGTLPRWTSDLFPTSDIMWSSPETCSIQDLPPPGATCSRPSGRYTSNWNAFFFIFKTIFVGQCGPIKNLTCKVVVFLRIFYCHNYTHLLYFDKTLCKYKYSCVAAYVCYTVQWECLQRTSRRCTSPSQVLLITEIFASNLPNLYPSLLRPSTICVIVKSCNAHDKYFHLSNWSPATKIN